MHGLPLTYGLFKTPGLIILCATFIFVMSCTDRAPTQNPDDNRQGKVVQPPILSAGEDQIVTEKTQIVLAGSIEHDPDNTYVYSWTSNPNTVVTFGDSNRLSTIFVAPAVTAQEKIEFTLSATDQIGGVFSDSVFVTVNPQNINPTIQSPNNPTFFENSAIFISPIIFDEDGSIDRIEWRQLSGIPVDIENKFDQKLSFTAPEVDKPEALLFGLSATDNEGGNTETQIPVLIQPTFIDPTVTAIPNLSINSFEKVDLAVDAKDKDGMIVHLNWTQLSGMPVKLIGNADNHLRFTAPGVREKTTLTFLVEVKDNDNLTASTIATVTITPPPAIEINGHVAFGHELKNAEVTAKRIVDSELVELDSSATAYAVSPTGEFSMHLPGPGIYQLIAASAVTTPDNRLSSVPVILKSITQLSDGTNTNINILTTLTSDPIRKQLHSSNVATLNEIVQNIEDQFRLNLQPFLRNETRPFSELHSFNGVASNASPDLVIATQTLKDYATTLTSNSDPFPAMMALLDNASNHFTTENILKTDWVNAIAARIPFLDPVYIAHETKLSVESDPGYSAPDLNASLDSDLDGTVNLFDEDDDNDGIHDELDEEPYGFRMIKTPCQSGDIADIFTDTSDIYNIANRWKPNQYLNIRLNQLKSSPLISPLESVGRWVIEKNQRDGLVIRIKTLDQNFALGASATGQLTVGEVTSSAEDEFMWRVERAYPSLSHVKLYHLRNEAHPDYYLSTSSQNGNLNNLYDVVVNPEHQDGSWSSQWGFCVAEERHFTQIDANRNAPEHFLRNACTENGYTDPHSENDATYHIQSGSRASQFLNRLDGLGSNPVLDGNIDWTQWKLISLPVNKGFLIQSNGSDKLYLMSDAQNQLFLDQIINISNPDDYAVWKLVDTVDVHQAFNIINQGNKLSIQLNQSHPDGLTVTNLIKLAPTQKNQQVQSWRFCQID